MIIPNNNNVINICCVYEIHPIASNRDTTFTIQNALFGAMQITKDANDNSKNNYKGYGICFDERSQFDHTITEDGRAHTTNGRNVLIFGVDMSFSVHAINRANNIYVMGDGLTQGIHDTTLYVEKNYWRNFTDPDKNFVISLHYNGDDSYFFVNGRQELKFKCKTDQFVKERFCIGNFSDQWTVSLFNLIVTKALKCVSVVKQKCIARPKIINTNGNEPVFYPLSIKVNKCSSDCNKINDLMAKLCVPDVVKDLNVKVFNMPTRINETRKVVWHKTCKCVCRLTSAICNDKREWNENKCVCKCKDDLVSKLVCDKGYMWNPSPCACECDKYCEIAQYLDYKNWVCRKKMIDDLIEQCTSIVNMEIKNSTISNDAIINNKSYESSNNTYFILFIVFLVLFMLLLVLLFIIDIGKVVKKS